MSYQMIGSGAQRERSLCAAVTGWLTGMNAGQWSNFKDFCGTRFYSTHAFRLEQAACREGSRGLEVAYTWVLGIALLLGSMHFWSWLIQLNRSYKYIGKFASTRISTLNGHIKQQPNFQEFRLKWWRKKLFFCIVGTSWMGWGRVEWYWHMGMSYLTSLNTHIFKNIAYVGSYEHFSV